MKRNALSIALCVVSAAGAFAQTKPKIEGVWKVIEWTESGKTNSNPQPGLIIFTKGYYSVAMLMAPRAALMPSDMGRELSDAEKIEYFEQWKWFVGVSGSYEVKGSTVVLRPIVAKTTWDTNRQSMPEFRLDAPDTLWLVPPAARKVGLRIKLTRLE